MDIFKGENLLEFTSRFDSDESCKAYLAEIKWENGYTCTKCGYQKSQIRKDHSRTCNKCSHTESSTAGTLFHKVKFGLKKAYEDKVKRAYAILIPDYSSKSLRRIFDKHISTNAQVTTDEWKGYKPISKDYTIEQIPSKLGQNFKAIHTVMHQIKSTARAIHSWMAKRHVDNYLAEYCFRINRSIFKETIFHKLVSRMVIAQPSSYQKIICT